MSNYRLYQVDVFTRDPFSGNPAGVVPNAAGMTGPQMQAIAGELGSSGTAFLLPPNAADHDLRVRFFTATMEVPFCGHATIAAHYVRAVEQQLPACRVRQKTGKGILPVEVMRSGSDYRIAVTQGRPVLYPPFGGGAERAILTSLGLRRADLDDRCPLQIVDTGYRKVLVGIRDREHLQRVRPNLLALQHLSHVLPNYGYLAFSLATDDPEASAYVRSFAPQIGINEDSITGNGSASLGAYLVHHGLVSGNGHRLHLRIRQGRTLGRPGTAHVWVEHKGCEPSRVQVVGDAVIAFRAELGLCKAPPGSGRLSRSPAGDDLSGWHSSSLEAALPRAQGCRL